MGKDLGRAAWSLLEATRQRLDGTALVLALNHNSFQFVLGFARPFLCAASPTAPEPRPRTWARLAPEPAFKPGRPNSSTAHEPPVDCQARTALATRVLEAAGFHRSVPQPRALVRNAGGLRRRATPHRVQQQVRALVRRAGQARARSRALRRKAWDLLSKAEALLLPHCIEAP